MDLGKAVDIFFFGMAVGACFAVWFMRRLRERDRSEHADSRREKTPQRDA